MAHTADTNAVLGTWRLQSYIREVLETGERYNQFGEDPDGYIGYSPDGRDGRNLHPQRPHHAR